MKTLADTGDEAFDDLPLPLVPALLQSVAADAGAITVGADLRTRGFAIGSMLDSLDESPGRTPRELKVLFIDCDDERLQRRYTETRPRPLAGDQPVLDGIRLERASVHPLRDRADLVIDTSNPSVTELKCLLTGHFALGSVGLRVLVTSFSYRYGIPRDADLIFDVRVLDNPHYVPGLRPGTGLHPGIARHMECERHRSVHVAKRLTAQLRGVGVRVELSHCDLLTSGVHAAVPATSAPALAS